MSIKSYFLSTSLSTAIAVLLPIVSTATEYEQKSYDPYDAGLLVEPECRDGVVCIQQGVIKLQDKIRKEINVLHKADLLVLETIRFLAWHQQKELAASEDLIMLTSGLQIYRDLILKDYADEAAFRKELNSYLIFVIDPWVIRDILYMAIQFENRAAIETVLTLLIARDASGLSIDDQSKILSWKLAAYNALGDEISIRREIENLKKILSSSRGEGGGVMYAQRVILELLQTGKHKDIIIETYKTAAQTENWTAGVFIDACISAINGDTRDAQALIEDRLTKNERFLIEKLNKDFKISDLVRTFAIVHEFKNCAPMVDFSRIDDEIFRIVDAVKSREDILRPLDKFTIDFLMARYNRDWEEELKIIQKAITEARKMNYSGDESSDVIYLMKLAAGPSRFEVN